MWPIYKGTSGRVPKDTLSNCVYESLWQAVFHVTGKKINPASYQIYRAVKNACHGNILQETYGGIVPFIVDAVATYNGLYTVKQHVLIGKKEYLDMCGDNVYQRHFTQLGDFGEFVPQITLCPAIYLGYKVHHAWYDTNLPDTMCIMAIKLMEKIK